MAQGFLNNDRGIVMVIVVMVVIVFMVMSTSIMMQAINQSQISQQASNDIRQEEETKAAFWKSYTNAVTVGTFSPCLEGDHPNDEPCVPIVNIDSNTGAVSVSISKTE